VSNIKHLTVKDLKEILNQFKDEDVVCMGDEFGASYVRSIGHAYGENNNEDYDAIIFCDDEHHDVSRVTDLGMDIVFNNLKEE